MMDLLGMGFAKLFSSWEPFTFILLGVAIGTVIGALPGLSATTGIVLLLPLTYGLDVSIGLLMLGGIYCGALYGGSISAILLGIPGTAAALPTTFDGYPLSRQGRAYDALLAGLYGSSFGGICSALCLMFLTPIIAHYAIKFGTAEMFLLGLWGMAMVTGVLGGDIVKGLFMAALGMLLGAVGPDPVNGISRFTFGVASLIGGFDIVPVMLGALAMPRAYEMIEHFTDAEVFFQPQKERKFFIKPKEVIKRWFLLIRSALIGVVIGIAPAAGPAVAAMISYNTAAKSSKDPDSFGKGNIDGVWAAETANNGATGGSLVLTLSLGVPGSAAAAVLMSALTLKGLTPGPLLLKSSASLCYEFFVGFLVANILVFIIGHAFVQVGGYVIKTPVKLLAPAILIICLVGAWTASRMSGIIIALVISIIAHLLAKFKFPMAPMLLGVILYSIIEKNFHSYYQITQGHIERAFTRPMFLALFALVILTLALPPIITAVQKRRGKVYDSDPNEE